MHDRKQDWKTFTSLKEIALERFFEQAMGKFESIMEETSLSAKERYHKLYNMVLILISLFNLRVIYKLKQF